MEVVFKLPSFALFGVEDWKFELTEIIEVDLRERFSVNCDFISQRKSKQKKNRKKTVQSDVAVWYFVCLRCTLLFIEGKTLNNK